MQLNELKLIVKFESNCDLDRARSFNISEEVHAFSGEVIQNYLKLSSHLPALPSNSAINFTLNIWMHSPYYESAYC
jgi:hypothetical protein